MNARRWLWAGLALAVAAAGVGAFFAFWRGDEVVSPDLGAADPEVSEAVEEARSAVARSPRSGRAWGELAMTLHAHGYLREAARAYAVAARREPREGDWPYLRGVILSEGDRPEEGLADLGEAVRLTPDSAHRRARYAEVLFALGREGEAREHFRALLDADEGSARARFGLAQAAAAGGERDEALRLLEAKGGVPTRRAAALRASIYGAKGDRAGVERERELLERKGGDEPWPDDTLERAFSRQVGLDARLRQGRDLARTGRAAEARAVLEAAAARHPNSDVAWVDLGVALALAGDAEAAERAMAKGAGLAPGKAEHWLTLAGLLMARKKFADAEAAYRRALALVPESVTGHLGVGDCLRARGDRDGAAAAYREALRHRPGMPEAAQRLREARRE